MGTEFLLTGNVSNMLASFNLNINNQLAATCLKQSKFYKI